MWREPAILRREVARTRPRQTDPPATLHAPLPSRTRVRADRAPDRTRSPAPRAISAMWREPAILRREVARTRRRQTERSATTATPARRRTRDRADGAPDRIRSRAPPASSVTRPEIANPPRVSDRTPLPLTARAAATAP